MENVPNSLPSIDVLLVIDAIGALVSGDLTNNTYMVDTNKYMGSSGQGTNKLHTKCFDTQRINWRVSSVSPNCDLKIIDFHGGMVNEKVCVPLKQGGLDDEYWTARVQARLTPGQKATYSYYCKISIQGKIMEFDPYIEVEG